MSNKYKLICTACGADCGDFSDWFAHDQKCSCGCQRAEAVYNADYGKLFDGEGFEDSLFRYFDFLPLEDRANVVSCGEGAEPIEEWDFLEEYARSKHGVDCKVFVVRNDLNGGSGTFKDIAAALGASIFKEKGVRNFCLASTGNAATAFSRYCSLAGVTFDVFMPNDVCKDTADTIRSHGQILHISQGGYGAAKKEAADFHVRENVLISAGNIDPIRVEAKRTMAFEFLRQLGKMPDVFFQAVAGGTGPIALDKGVRELQKYYDKNIKMPRLILAQQDTCDPMVRAWEKATAENFPKGWEKDYPTVIPQTKISILSAGTPGMYPVVAPMVRATKGGFVRVQESELASLAKKIQERTGVIFGPASMVCFAGFCQALAQNMIHQGETILLNIGEGSERARWFAKEVEDCK
ncbi:MAG: pyridoxal-phosphate dependent enzyme [Bacteroidales bacterium]|nr:pyridoxal-phosphate dependent enzyme [Bacteroidales bacterium]